MLKKLLNFFRRRPYMLYVYIDTDDDAKVIYQGLPYCFYGDNLVIVRRFHTVEECYDCLRNEIVILPGFKISEVLAEWIEDFIAKHKKGEGWQGIHGNQTIEIEISVRG